MAGDTELAIWIEADAAKKTLTIRDNGIGMSREEAVSHLGTIARSGTSEFFKKLSGDQQKDSQLIGQFGVGFYSAFIVADRVEVLTRRAGLAPSEGVRWESAADGEFSVETIERRGAWHHHRAAPQGGRQGVPRHLAPALAGAALFGSHRLPGAHAERGRGHARVRGRQSRHGALGASQGRDQGRGVRRVLPSPDARFRRAADLVAQPRRGQARLHQPRLHPRRGTLRPVAARWRARAQAVRAARVHHGRRRAVPAAVPALRQRCAGFGGPAAERVARTAADRTARWRPCAPR